MFMTDVLKRCSMLEERVAASLLQQHGYTNVVNVLGGMTAWKQADLPTVKEETQN